ncbi:Arabinose 5-phosphate isomerase KdsD [Defluviimonas aquaemixtae]|uniref:Arabinose 5-phosphate isomerase KdsD n=1 Tax=Albidovulum aquaemixtae TaxID=1542388 RepID=A0A2R8BJP1_9RHOB|nr:KpsF/GutQ family sugar-phosphate isomerase [Defluviimonas aquaemixtae]SPH23616.1 Arabinose 5-phosphate isomerase KdsD [Defluviimonas aquaemixtae]
MTATSSSTEPNVGGETFLATARRVIGIEAAGLAALSDALGDSFAEAIDLILKAKGRVIVSGMGKSGHVGRKIAATLASTGTPAQYVHPAEASHGDLGMVTEGDVALVLSNSGETPELKDIIAHTRRFSIPLIGIASRPGSTLLRQSDVAIVLPDAEEACGTGVVPTTSTTMTLALGDALAVVLMEHRRFTPEHFRTFHPGGKLGAMLMKVEDLMHGGDAVPLVPAGTQMSDALLTMSQKGFGVVGVTDAKGRLMGIVTDGDLRRHMAGLLDHTADEVMTEGPLTIGPGEVAQKAVALMRDRKITCLFVVDPEGDGLASGLIHIHDCLRAGVV